jgi:hypothetical protein
VALLFEFFQETILHRALSTKYTLNHQPLAFARFIFSAHFRHAFPQTMQVIKIVMGSSALRVCIIK